LADSFSQRFFILKKLPESLLQSLQDVEGFNRETFVKTHEEGEQVTSIRINPAKCSLANGQWLMGQASEFSRSGDSFPVTNSLINYSPLATHEQVPWSQFGFYLQERPSFTFDPLFHAGCYYVQEASSMFLEQVFRQLPDPSQPLKVLDLCAAPGGKSTHIQSLISQHSLLVSNEIIKSRNHVLTDNIVKWGSSNVIVTNNDPSAFKKLEGYFDVIVVDAPCSGSGLFRKDEEAIGEWSLNNVQLCSQRQQRILADVLPALKEGGLLVYSTCSYSMEEDEEIADWLTEDFGLQTLSLNTEAEWNIVETHSPKNRSTGYRFYPDKLRGEGLFMTCFRKTSATAEAKIRPGKMEKASAKEKLILQSWLKKEGDELIKDNQLFFVLPSHVLQEYQVLNTVLNVQYKGTGVGQIMKDKLVPEHSLALSGIVSDNIPFNDLSYEEAIKYLQKQEVNFNTSGKGWQLVRYHSRNLGWVNVLPNRINNYYPKELRILKQRNDSSFEK
jgi:16S rRNA C967 or C1407 C5-methylase (RsmB/RsmF family)/NOL1/NOP2/fmu family ribosome biogenesis protein